MGVTSIKKIVVFSIICMLFIWSCKNNNDTVGHTLEADNNILKIEYNGVGDIVQFKMYEGLHSVLKKTANNHFEGDLEIPNIENGVFSYEIIVHQEDCKGNMTSLSYQPKSKEKHFRWIGSNRNVVFSKAKSLVGEVKNVFLESSYLHQERKLTVYYPKDISTNTPIIYLTDGSIVSIYANYVDSLITQKKISPVILVGIHSSKENRYKEYVNNGLENHFFGKHESFFLKEVIPLIENDLNNWEGKRYMYGFSNGAAFCMYVGLNHPDYFDEIIAFSTADYISEFIKPIEFKFENYPKFYMGVGRYEKHFYNNTITFSKKLENQGIDVELKEFISGHDYYVWQIEFLEYITSIDGISYSSE